MDKARKDMLDKAFTLAKKYEMENGNCAQCVFSGVTEALGVENDEVFRAATGFADGIGLTGDGHCGALSGGVMAISCLFGRKRDEFARRERAARNRRDREMSPLRRRAPLAGVAGRIG